MNETDRRYSKRITIAVLAGALLISSEMPLLAASPQQSNTSSQQSNATVQKQDDALPEAPHTSEGWHDASIVRRGVAQTINVSICIGSRGLGFQTHSTERRENSGLPKHSAA